MSCQVFERDMHAILHLLYRTANRKALWSASLPSSSRPLQLHYAKMLLWNFCPVPSKMLPSWALSDWPKNMICDITFVCWILAFKYHFTLMCDITFDIWKSVFSIQKWCGNWRRWNRCHFNVVIVCAMSDAPFLHALICACLYMDILKLKNSHVPRTLRTVLEYYEILCFNWHKLLQWK